MIHWHCQPEWHIMIMRLHATVTRTHWQAGMTRRRGLRVGWLSLRLLLLLVLVEWYTHTKARLSDVQLYTHKSKVK